MTAHVPYSSAELSRFAMRIMLLAILSGLHHLPPETVSVSELKEAKAGVRSAYDFLIAGGQVRVVSLLLAKHLQVFKCAGIDPMEIYTRATVARVGSVEAAKTVPIDCEGTVIEFPAPARGMLQAENSLRLAAEDRRRLYRSAVAEIERLAFNAHLITGKPERDFYPVRNFAHHAELFLANASLQGSELVWTECKLTSDGYDPIRTEGELIKRHMEAVELLGKNGVDVGASIPEGSAPVRKRRPIKPLSDNR